MNCELCGQKPAVYDSEIEGTTMNVCEDCVRFGSSKKKRNTNNVNIVLKEKKQEQKEPIFMFVQGYGAIVKRAREKLGLKQEEMAKRLNERESLLHQIESEHIKPSIDTARKLQRELRIKILEEIKDVEEQKKFGLGKSEELTLGHFIRKK